MIASFQQKPSSSAFFAKKIGRRAFSLVELLVTIVILSILASMVVTAVSNAAVDSSKVLARQQQAALQQALNSWITTYSANGSGLEHARSVYNAAGNSLTKFVLIAPFLDPAMAAHIQTNSTMDRLESHALQRAGAYLTLSGWSGNTHPSVNYIE
jgi:prepilin-type N-terminal cleavage/methylation domain-containing protein